MRPNEGPFGPGPAQEGWTDGFIGAGTVGWALPNGLKIDVFGASDYNNVNNLVPVPGKQTGYQDSYGGFLEVLYGVDLTKFGIPIKWISPYAGVGAGALWTHVNLPEPLSTATCTNIGGTSGANFAYEGILGAAFPVPAVPGLAVMADYRLVGIHNAGDLNGTSYSRPEAETARGPIGLQRDIFVYLSTVGVAYAFNAAPPDPRRRAGCQL